MRQVLADTLMGHVVRWLHARPMLDVPEPAMDRREFRRWGVTSEREKQKAAPFPARPSLETLAPRPGLEPGTCGLTGHRGVACFQTLRPDSVPQFPQVAPLSRPEGTDSRTLCGTAMLPSGALWSWPSESDNSTRCARTALDPELTFCTLQTGRRNRRKRPYPCRETVTYPDGAVEAANNIGASATTTLSGRSTCQLKLPG